MPLFSDGFFVHTHFTAFFPIRGVHVTINDLL